MSLTSHSVHMRIQAIARYLRYLYPLTLVVAWAVVIWVALHVSTIVLNTLDMIVELAAMT